MEELCQECKHKKMEQMNVEMRVGALPHVIGECEICKKYPIELYGYEEIANFANCITKEKKDGL